eukprot:scaffold1277_cov137-Skeletonema_menzelii.AAC.4
MKDTPTPLQIEKAKASALAIQLERYKQENERIVALLKKTQHNLEKKTQLALTLQIQQSEMEKVREKQAIAAAKVEEDELQNLREELLTARRDLTKQLSLSKKREQEHEQQVERLKRQLDQLNNDRCNDESLKNMEHRTKTLEKCQSELIVLVKKQIKLIEILKEQRNHARAAALLGITEKTFLKEITV